MEHTDLNGITIVRPIINKISLSVMIISICGFSMFLSLFAADLPLDSFPIVLNNTKIDKGPWKIVMGSNEMFAVSKEAERYVLHAFTTGKNFCVAKKVSLSLSAFPILTWAWKTVVLPLGGREDTKKKNDSAAGIIIGMRCGLTFHAIKYVWSSSLPQGSLVQDEPDAFDRVIVLQSGKELCGTWVRQKVNLRQDIRRCFGDSWNAVDAVSIMTDSDNTHSTAEAFYTDITFMADSIANTHL